MTLEETFIFMIFAGALMARKYPKYLLQTTDPEWINALIETRSWLHAKDIRL